MSLFVTKLHAQILSTTPNEYFAPSSFSAFQLPTSTDVINIAGNPLQVIVATTPNATLFWDDNNGHKSNYVISSFPTSSKVLLDDVALAIDGSNEVYAYITCRVLLNNGTTEIHLLTFSWNTLTNSFIQTPLPTLITSRATSNDIFDGVRVSINNQELEGKIMFAWQSDGNIYCNSGYVNFISGDINYFSGYCPTGLFGQNQLLLAKASYTFIYGIGGNFSNPDVSNESGCYNIVSAIFKNVYGKTDIVVGNESGFLKCDGFANNSTFRTPRLAFPIKGEFIISYNELSIDNKKSFVKLLAGTLHHSSPQVCSPIILNQFEEIYCNNNDNFKLTGFPSIKYLRHEPNGFLVEVVWQQVLCNGTDFCNIQSLAKRAVYVPNTNLNPSLPFIQLINGTQYLNINSDLSINSFFPSIACDKTIGKSFYSFNVFDKNTSLNGLVGYKKNFISSSSIKILQNLNSKTDINEIMNLANFKSKIIVYPNPSSETIYVKSKDKISLLEAFSLTGLLLYKITINNFSATLNTSKWPSGQYVLKIYNKDGSFKIEKIIVNH